MRQAARLIVHAKPDVIIAQAEMYALAARRATPTIPIVMINSGYPVESGLVASLAHPGGNVTGNAIYAGTGIWGKLVELLRDLKPGIRRICVLWDYVPPALRREEVEPAQQEATRAAEALGLTVTIVEVADPNRVTAAIAKIDASRPDALLVTSGSSNESFAKAAPVSVNGGRLPHPARSLSTAVTPGIG